MPDKKLTDSEIIKALTICAENDKCWLCPIQKKCKGFPNLHKDALDLINRLQAENESIRRKSLLEAASKFAGHSNYHGDTILCKLICMSEGKEVNTAKPLDMSEIKVEAYKEFAERVKKETNYLFTAESIEVEVDNILKELVGENNA